MTFCFHLLAVKTLAILAYQLALRVTGVDSQESDDTIHKGWASLGGKQFILRPNNLGKSFSANAFVVFLVLATKQHSVKSLVRDIREQ